MLLIYNYKSRFCQRGKNRRPGTDHNICFSLCNPVPLVKPLPGSKTAMEQSHPGTESAQKMSFKLRSKGYFRHQNQYGFSQLKGSRCSLKVHLSLAAAGDTMQQKGRKNTFFQRRDNTVQRLNLFPGQCFRDITFQKTFTKRVPVHLLFFDKNKIFLRQRFQALSSAFVFTNNFSARHKPAPGYS